MKTIASISKAFSASIQRALDRFTNRAGVGDKPKGIANRDSFKEPPRTFRMRLAEGSGARGPAIVPERADHHVSRQACREYLRAYYFSQAGTDTLATRRERRRFASLCARLEYRRMMKDPTNTGVGLECAA